MPVDVVHIRPPRLKDAPALAAAYEEAWRNAYQGIIPHLSLERMIVRRGLRWWEGALRKRTPLLVLDFGGEAAGYVTYGRSRLGRTQFQGEIFELYLHPIYQGLGLGEKLFDGARDPACRAQAQGPAGLGARRQRRGLRLLSQPRRQARRRGRRELRRCLAAQSGLRLGVSGMSFALAGH